MKLDLLPKTYLGKLSAVLIPSFVWGLFMLRLLVSLGEQGGRGFFDNPKLAVLGLISAISAIASFFTGLVAITRWEERSIMVFIAVVFGCLVLLFVLGEIVFPH